MNCKESFEMLYQYIDKDTDSLSMQEIEDHLKLCRPCWDRFEFEKKLKERLHKSCQTEVCSESLKQRIKALLDKY